MSSAIAIPHPAKIETAEAKLRVLTITPFFPSLKDPAQGCFVAEPLARFGPMGIESRVLAVNPFYRPLETAYVKWSEWARYACLPGNAGLVTSGPFLASSARKRIRQFDNDFRIDLIHAHAALPCGQAASTLAEELGVPFVVSVHGLDVMADQQAGRWLGRWTRRASHRVYQQAKAIVCISEKVRGLLPADIQHKSHVIYNGVDPEMFRPNPVKPAKLRVLSVGNLIPSKDHALLLRAFATVSRKNPGVELEIIGDGPQREHLTKLANALEISDKTFFRGRQDRIAVAKAMRSCSVFALPSYYEGLGCVYLEAMACAKPAIGCYGQGIDEIIRDGQNGLLVYPHDESGLTLALEAVLQDSQLRTALGAAGRNTILQRHTLDQQAAEFTSLYRECVS